MADSGILYNKDKEIIRMYFNDIKTRFGFGCMRLKLNEDKTVDETEFNKMIDLFIKEGFTYFDTARVYLNGESEKALKNCLVKRYKRDSFTLTDKLTTTCFEKQKEIRPFFFSQLESLQTDYLDFYLFHALNKERYEKYKKEHAFEEVKKLKDEGYIKHVGLSFHDTSDVLETILQEQNDLIEVVQIQFNYLDLYNPNVMSQACYDVCVKYNKPVLVMEPIKGGSLINLPDKAKKIVKDLNLTEANLALRFVLSHPQVFMILSGMSTIDMMKENISIMKEDKPLNKSEIDAIKEITKILKSKELIPCTGCHYCTDGCPMGIKIPELFKLKNDHTIYPNHFIERDYNEIVLNSSKASQCIQCRQCENICPQKIEVVEELKKIAAEFE